jgi:hypothetical protein
MATLQHGDHAVDEMVIVDTFTRLIFGDQTGFSELELAIIDGLRRADLNVALDDYADMGAYLRALGVAEMVALVARVEHQLSATHSEDELAALSALAATSQPAPNVTTRY